MSVARFIADQRTKYRVPQAICCALLGVSPAWFYKWISRAGAGGPHTATDCRRAEVDAAVKVAFTVARGLHGSPRLVADLRDRGWTISEKTVADSMRRQALVARRIRRRQGLTRQDRTAPKFPDLVKRDFTANAPALGPFLRLKIRNSRLRKGPNSVNSVSGVQSSCRPCEYMVYH